VSRFVKKGLNRISTVMEWFVEIQQSWISLEKSESLRKKEEQETCSFCGV
jgi:hypothetical protein